MKIYHKFLLYQNKWIHPYVRMTVGVMTSITYLASILLIVGVVYEHGFTISEVEAHQLQRLYHGVWIVFLVDVTLRNLLEYKDTRRTFSKLTWILTILLYLTLIPVIFHRPEEEGAILQFWEFLHGKAYHLVLLLVFSFFSLSNGLVRLLGRRTNPSLILAASFLIIIMIGTGLLMLPRCTMNGISWVDSLFISTSAVCVTGLTSVDVASTFTPTGFVVIILLIQIGGLGVMTLTSFFAMFFMGNTSLYNQLVVRDMVSSNSLNSLLSTLVYILAFTLVIEGIGMLAIWGDIHGTMGMDLQEELAFSAFHAISAFCNAGFSTLPGNLGNPLVMTGHNPFFIYISLLIILGGIGFPILVNFKDIILYHLRRLWHFLLTWHWDGKRFYHLYNLNTKRAKVEEGGKIEWVSGSFGSHVSYLYPMSILNGEGASAEFTGITFAGKGQNLDTGTKVVHNAPNTSSYVNTKSISKDGGVSTFRSSVVVNSKAKHSKSAVSCQSLMLDDISRSDTIPAMDIRTKDANIGHEARIGRISDEAVFYLMSRGISEEDARAMIVSGFADEVSKELPLEYAMEMNNLIRLEMKGSIG